MKSFRVTKTAEQIEEQKKIEEISLTQLEQFFGVVADPTLEVTPITFPENKVEPNSLDGLNEFFQLLSSVKPETPIVIESELMWAADSLNLNLSAQPATAFCPSIPSVILTVNQTNL